MIHESWSFSGAARRDKARSSQPVRTKEVGHVLCIRAEMKLHVACVLYDRAPPLSPPAPVYAHYSKASTDNEMIAPIFIIDNHYCKINHRK